MNRVVEQSSSSFLWGMRLLPGERRRAMYAIYAFCREVDGHRRRNLERLPTKGGRLPVGGKKYAVCTPDGRLGRQTRALLGPVHRFSLPQDEFFAVIDGMEDGCRADRPDANAG